MKIIVAPDSFKGSISARDLCLSIKKGIEKVFRLADVIEVPLADGGEGLIDSLIYSTGGILEPCNVTNPLGEMIQSAYGILGDQETVVIEMARASGLTLVPKSQLNPLVATSFGTGELILAALNKGYRKFIIGLGGSATNDGGIGMLQGLGARFYDKNGELLTNAGEALLKMNRFDESFIDKRLKEASFTIASDVVNPLCGANGASYVFGPQKGATPEMVEILDQSLYRFAEIIMKQKGFHVLDSEGAGAAGGMGAALMAFLGANAKSGIEVVMEAVGFNRLLEGADLVITGEGKLDKQTLSGKVIAGVCKEAGKMQVPVIALCGATELTASEMDLIGLSAAFSLVSGPSTLDDAIAHSFRLAEERTEQLFRFLRGTLLKEEKDEGKSIYN